MRFTTNNEQLTAGVLGPQGSRQVAQLGWHVLEVVGKGQRRIVWTETLFRAECCLNAVTGAFAFELLLDLVEQAAGVAMQIGHGNIALLEELTIFVMQRVGH